MSRRTRRSSISTLASLPIILLSGCNLLTEETPEGDNHTVVIVNRGVRAEYSIDVRNENDTSLFQNKTTVEGDKVKEVIFNGDPNEIVVEADGLREEKQWPDKVDLNNCASEDEVYLTVGYESEEQDNLRFQFLCGSP